MTGTDDWDDDFESDEATDERTCEWMYDRGGF